MINNIYHYPLSLSALNQKSPPIPLTNIKLKMADDKLSFKSVDDNKMDNPNQRQNLKLTTIHHMINHEVSHHHFFLFVNFPSTKSPKQKQPNANLLFY